MVTSTLDWAAAWSSKVAVPRTLVNEPRRLEIARKRTENSAQERSGSSCHAEVFAPARGDRTNAIPMMATLSSLLVQARIFKSAIPGTLRNSPAFLGVLPEYESLRHSIPKL